MKKYSRRWLVLTTRYLEWYDHPNGTRKQTIPLNHCYCRIHEGTGLIVGSWQTNKEWLLRDEGSSPAATANEWLEAINKAIENYKNVPGSARAATASRGDALVAVPETTTVQVNNQVAPAPAPVMQTNFNPPAYGSAPVVTTTTTQPAYQPPVRTVQQQTFYSAPAPVVQSTFQPAPVMTTVYQQPQPVMTTVYQQPQVQTVVYQQPQPVFTPTYTTTVVQQPQVQTFTHHTYGPPMY